MKKLRYSRELSRKIGAEIRMVTRGRVASPIGTYEPATRAELFALYQDRKVSIYAIDARQGYAITNDARTYAFLWRAPTFNSREDAIAWLVHYEGALERTFVATGDPNGSGLIWREPTVMVPGCRYKAQCAITRSDRDLWRVDDWIRCT